VIGQMTVRAQVNGECASFGNSFYVIESHVCYAIGLYVVTVRSTFVFIVLVLLVTRYSIIVCFTDARYLQQSHSFPVASDNLR